ncbi:MAG: hypothetical protein WCO97_11685, partial [bacterium]
MFDYLRGFVNNLNYAYRPITGTSSSAGNYTYGFPQNNHSPTDKYGIMLQGHNDITPLMIGNGTTLTKGLSSPMISEVLFQFYNAGEYYDGQTFDTSFGNYGKVTGNATDNKTFTMSGTTINGTAGADTIPDYIIRRVQMVCLLNLFDVMNSPNSFNQRFQLRITGTPFGLELSGNSSVDMRISGDPTAPWVKSIADIGFPGGAINSTLVCGQGEAGLGAAITFMDINDFTYGATPLQAKALSNTPTGATRPYDNIAITGNSTKYQIYPFVSHVIEFRIPNTTGNGTETSPFTIGNGTTLNPYKSPFDSTTVTFKGNNNLKIEVFPGLKKEASGNYTDNFTIYDKTTGSPVDPNFLLWDITDSSTPRLMSTTINVINTDIPLPRLGKQTEPANDFTAFTSNSTTAYFNRGHWTHNKTFSYGVSSVTNNGTTTTTITPSLKDMQYYPLRFLFNKRDYLLQLARDSFKLSDNSTVAATPDHDVVRAYHLDGAALSYGDLRLAAYRNTIPSNWWVEKNPEYFDPTKFVATSLVPDGTVSTYT